MHILLVNDDGIKSPGIWALYDELSKDNDVTICAPSEQRSGYSHSISLGQYMTVHRYKRGNARAYAVDGTPADCTMVGLEAFADKPFDLVISGINNGYNAAMDVHYSGTIGAAAEARMQGVRALAVSTDMGNKDFAATLKFTRTAIDMTMSDTSSDRFISLNVPAGNPEKLIKAELGALDRHVYFALESEQDDLITLKSTNRYSGYTSGCDSDLLMHGQAVYSVLSIDWTHKT
jgi:5'-nucleotidase